MSAVLFTEKININNNINNDYNNINKNTNA